LSPAHSVASPLARSNSVLPVIKIGTTSFWAGPLTVSRRWAPIQRPSP
jgi:hypothetical protein